MLAVTDLEKSAAHVDHVCIKVAGFDRKAGTDKLQKLGAEISASNDENLLRFKDPNGLAMELTLEFKHAT
jgi:hypothetical protein